MRTFIVLLLMCLVMITSCWSPITSISYDYNRGIDFSGLRTYDWLSPPTEMQGTEALMLERIKRAVDSRLEAKGLRVKEGDPDFLIATNFGQVDKLRVHSWGYPYRPYWRDYYYGPSYGGGVSSYYYQEGTLTLDFFDTDLKKVIWKGTAKGVLSKDLTPEKIDKIVNEAVEKILVNFPPTSTE